MDIWYRYPVSVVIEIGPRLAVDLMVYFMLFNRQKKKNKPCLLCKLF